MIPLQVLYAESWGMMRFGCVKTQTEWNLKTIGGRAVLIFPPTYGALALKLSPDWRANFDALIVPYKDMGKKWRAHRGFTRKYKSVRDAILKAVEPCPSLTVTGLSQGGALATLAHEDIAFHFPNMDIETITFGAPRVVGWRAPPERWDRLTRYEVRGDLVCALPPAGWGYKHVGDVVKLGPWCPLWPWKHGEYPKYLGEV